MSRAREKQLGDAHDLCRIHHYIQVTTVVDVALGSWNQAREHLRIDKRYHVIVISGQDQ